VGATIRQTTSSRDWISENWSLKELNDDLAGHLRVNRAEVRIGAGFSERKRKGFVGIENPRLET
jgi:hypothetical protein